MENFLGTGYTVTVKKDADGVITYWIDDLQLNVVYTEKGWTLVKDTEDLGYSFGHAIYDEAEDIYWNDDITAGATVKRTVTGIDLGSGIYIDLVNGTLAVSEYTSFECS